MRRLTISTFLAGIVGALVLSLLLFSGGNTTQAATGVTDATNGQVAQMSIDLVPGSAPTNAPGTGTTTVSITKVTTTAGGTITTSPGPLAAGFTAGDSVTITGSNTTPPCNGTFTILTAGGATMTLTGGCPGLTAGCNPPGACTGTATTKHLLGSVDTVLSNVPVVSTVPIDIIVDEIATADGNETAFGYNLVYDPTIISIQGHNAATGGTDGPMIPGGAGCEIVNPPDPDTSGNWREDCVTLGAGSHYGEGVETHIGIECDAVGHSHLALTNGVVFTATNTNGDPTAPIIPNFLGGADIYCGIPAPTTVNESISSNTTSPATAPVNTNFVVTDVATVTNATAAGPVTNSVTQTLTLAAGCTTSSPNPNVQSISVPASGSNTATANWTVQCSNSSFHTFSVTQTEAITDPSFIDGSSGNDSDTDTSTTGITATSDPTVTGGSAASDHASACLPASPPAPGCATAPVVSIGTSQVVTVTKTLKNLSGYNGETVRDTVVWGGAQEAPGGVTSLNPCSPTGPTTCTWTGGPAASAASSQFGTGCTVVPVGPAGDLGAGSSTQVSPPLSGSTTTLTFQFTATCTNNSFYNSTSPQQIALIFADQITDVDSPDHHVTDSNPANNAFSPIILAFWNRNPNFNPIFTYTIDSTDNTNQTADPNTIPSTHSCFSNQVAFPGGLPCEQYTTSDIAAGMPLSVPTILVPQHNTGLGSKGFTFVNGLLVPNGSITGYFGFNVDVNFGTGCNVPLGAPYPAVALKDGALPDHTTSGDPPGNAAEGPDLAGGTAAILTNPAVWPTNLNVYAGVTSLVAAGAVIWERYTATDPVLGTAVNILVFNAGTQYYTITITGDPAGPGSPPESTCTPFHTQTDYLGKIAATGQILRTCDDPNGPSNPAPYVIAASYTRADTYESVNRADLTNSCQASDTAINSMTKNEVIGQTPPAANEVDGGITYTQTVNLVLQGTGDLTLSLVGPAVCNPHWTNPLDAFPNNIGGTQTSVVTIPNATGNVSATYSFNCPPGDYSFQIIANMTPGNGETNTANNQAENHVSVHVVTDIDHDGVPNNTDQCPTVAEDHDGVQDSDGCPDTNVSVSDVKEENYNVDVSVDTAKTVSITVTNGNFPANVVVNITAISQIGACEVRLTPHAGDTYSEYFTDETPGLPNPDTLTSQISFTLPMAAGQSNVYSYTYTIHCYQKSSHPGAFELQVDATPQAPVVEENLGLGQFPCGTPGHTSDDNVTKNCPNVTAWERSDISKTGCVTTSPATQASGTTFTVSSSCTLKNNGPYLGNDVAYSDSSTLTAPVDCTITGANPQVATGTFTGGNPVNVGATWTVNCANPSFHTFTVNDTVSLTAPVHVYDPCPNPPAGPVPGEPTCANNNTGSASSTTAITTITDASVAAGPLNCGPANAEVNATVTCTETDTVVLGLASSATLTSTLSVPSDCTISTPNPVSQAAANGANNVSWTLTCANPSDHTISKTVVLTPVFPLHVSETNTANDSGSASVVQVILQHPTLTVAVTSPAEIDISGTSTTVSPGVSITSVPSGVAVSWVENWSNASATIACLGIPAAAVNHTGTTPISTTTNPVTLTIPATAHECGFTVCVTATATANHVVATGTDCKTTVIESDVLQVKYVILVGPAAVNLSDTNGRYMWIISEIGNFSSDTELVHINMSLTGALPNGCNSVVSQILPGQSQFLVSPLEQKVLVWRVRYECHAPATAQVITQTVTVGVTHCDTTTSAPAAGVAGTVTPTAPGGICSPNSETGTVANGDIETFLSDNSKTSTKQVIIQ